MTTTTLSSTPETGPDFNPSPPQGRKKFRFLAKLLGGVIAALVFYFIGATAGANGVDPTASVQYATLQENLDKEMGRYKSLSAAHADLRADLEEAQSAVAAAKAATESAEAGLSAREAAVAAAEQAQAAAAQAQAANTITDGTWTVGPDITPGTYRTTDVVESNCYWGIYRSGTNSSDIIDNDIPGGGRPTVTLKEGQDFNSTRCGSWPKQ